MSNAVYVGTSIDGYIADREGKLDFLESVPNPERNDMGFAAFMDSVDALLMGRKTFETVLGFGVAWPYTKHVFVYSSTLTSVPEELSDKVTIVGGELDVVINQLNEEGYKQLYIDGGELIQSLLREDKIDRMIIARLPVLLGGGISLFGSTNAHLDFEHVRTEVLLDAIVMTTYQRKR
jgi:dihydrofolate reductase